MSDGPNGVRGTRFFNGTPAACLPCTMALGATWDVDLIEKLGVLLGAEAGAKGTHVLLAPTLTSNDPPWEVAALNRSRKTLFSLVPSPDSIAKAFSRRMLRRR